MSKWIHIKIRVGNNTPTEKAVIRLFCHETYIKNGIEYAERSIDTRALPHTHKYIKANRASNYYSD